MSSRRRSNSLSRPVFRNVTNDDAFDFSKPRDDEGFAALNLAGQEEQTQSRANVTDAGDDADATTSTSPFNVTTLSNRPKPTVRKRIVAYSPSTLAPPPASSRPTPSRSMTRLVPSLPLDEAQDPNALPPLSNPEFLKGLKWAGYLEPLDTSRNKIKQRFNHFLDKQKMKTALSAFLEHAGDERLGESMVRFIGNEDAHSPYVFCFVKTPITTTESVKIYSSTDPSPSSTASITRSSTQWTYIKSNGQDSEWGCKAKRFWPVRVVLQGPKPDVGSATLPPSSPSRDRPRPKRRDTFQREVDLDAENRRRDEEEERDEKARIKANTIKNSARPGDSPSIHIDTKNTAPIAVPREEGLTPSTPTILESVKLLGQSVVASMPPSMQQLPTVMQSRLGEIKHWFDRPTEERERGGYGNEEEEEEEEERRRRARRKEKGRQRREREEEDQGRSIGRVDPDEEYEAEEAERRARKEERQRRRAERG